MSESHDGVSVPQTEFVRTTEAADICGITPRAFLFRAARLGLTRYTIPRTRGLWWKLEDVKSSTRPMYEKTGEISRNVH